MAVELETVHLDPGSDQLRVSFAVRALPRTGMPTAQDDARTVASLARAMLTRSPVAPEREEQPLAELRPGLPTSVLQETEALLSAPRTRGAGEEPDVTGYISRLAMAEDLKRGEVHLEKSRNAIKEAHRKAKEEIQSAKEAHEKQLAAARAEHERLVAEQARKFAKERSDFEAELEKQRLALAKEREALASARTAHGQATEALSRERAAHKADCEVLSTEREAHRKDAATLTAQLEEHRRLMAEERKRLAAEVAGTQRQAAADRKQLIARVNEQQHEAAEERKRIVTQLEELKRQSAEERRQAAALLAARLEEQKRDAAAEKQRIADQLAREKRDAAEERKRLAAQFATVAASAPQKAPVSPKRTKPSRPARPVGAGTAVRGREPNALRRSDAETPVESQLERARGSRGRSPVPRRNHGRRERSSRRVRNATDRGGGHAGSTGGADVFTGAQHRHRFICRQRDATRRYESSDGDPASPAPGAAGVDDRNPGATSRLGSNSDRAAVGLRHHRCESDPVAGRQSEVGQYLRRVPRLDAPHYSAGFRRADRHDAPPTTLFRPDSSAGPRIAHLARRGSSQHRSATARLGAWPAPTCRGVSSLSLPSRARPRSCSRARCSGARRPRDGPGTNARSSSTTWRRPGPFNVGSMYDRPWTAEMVANARASGITAVNVTVGLPGAPDPFEGTIRILAFLGRELHEHPDAFMPIRSAADIRRAKESKKLGLIAGFQDAIMLGSDVSRVDVFHGLGVRIIQLTYNLRNLLGDGCLEPGNAGLTDLGRNVVTRMNERGVLVDLSHCGRRTTSEAITAFAGRRSRSRIADVPRSRTCRGTRPTRS